MSNVSAATPADEAQLGHFAGLRGNLKEISMLFGLHRAIGGTGPGRRHNVEILNKSALVLLVGCWEAFIEDLATSAFGHLLSAAESPRKIPPKVLVQAGKALQGSDEKAVWQLAGEGWRQILERHRQETLERYIGRHHTPRTKTVNELLETLIGLRGLSTHWRWRGQNREAIEARLDALVTRRGEIAHRVKVARPVRKKEGEDAARFVSHLAACSSNAVADHLQKLTGKEAWPHVQIAFKPARPRARAKRSGRR